MFAGAPLHVPHLPALHDCVPTEQLPQLWLCPFKHSQTDLFPGKPLFATPSHDASLPRSQVSCAAGWAEQAPQPLFVHDCFEPAHAPFWFAQGCSAPIGEQGHEIVPSQFESLPFATEQSSAESGAIAPVHNPHERPSGAQVREPYLHSPFGEPPG